MPLNKAALSFVTLLVLGSAALAADSIKLADHGRFILPVTVGADMLKQCSRQSPKATDFWQPADADIDALEQQLVPFMATQKVKSPALFPPDVPYHRQYIGVKRDGEKFIYGNFYSVTDTGKATTENIQPVIVCDGGPSLWGIVYQVSTKQFESPSYNGSVR